MSVVHDYTDNSLPVVAIINATSAIRAAWSHPMPKHHPMQFPAFEIQTSPVTLPRHLKFKDEGPWTSPKCDNNYDPPLCSDLFHSQEQTPGYPQGDGNCAAPACDCGSVPCGMVSGDERELGVTVAVCPAA